MRGNEGFGGATSRDGVVESRRRARRRPQSWKLEPRSRRRAEVRHAGRRASQRGDASGPRNASPRSHASERRKAPGWEEKARGTTSSIQLQRHGTDEPRRATAARGTRGGRATTARRDTSRGGQRPARTTRGPWWATFEHPPTCWRGRQVQSYMYSPRCPQGETSSTLILFPIRPQREVQLWNSLRIDAATKAREPTVTLQRILVMSMGRHKLGHGALLALRNNAAPRKERGRSDPPKLR